MKEGKYLFVILFLIVLAIAGGIYVVSSNKAENPQNIILPTPTISANISPSELPQATNSAKTLTMQDGLQIQDEVIGNGAEVLSGKKVTVNYIGTLSDGTKFDSSYDRGTPLSFTVGAGEMIKGFDEGVVGMKVGGKRKLTIPSSLAYGDNGIAGVIPGGATIVFEVDLVSVQ